MDFAIPAAISQDLDRLRDFIRIQLVPDLPSWTRKQKMPKTFFQRMGAGGWYGFKVKDGRLVRGSALRETIIAEELAKASPGVAIVSLAHVDLGLMGLILVWLAASSPGLRGFRRAGKNRDVSGQHGKYSRQRCRRHFHARRQGRWWVDSERNQGVCHQRSYCRSGCDYSRFRSRS